MEFDVDNPRRFVPFVPDDLEPLREPRHSKSDDGGSASECHPRVIEVLGNDREYGVPYQTFGYYKLGQVELR